MADLIRREIDKGAEWPNRLAHPSLMLRLLDVPPVAGGIVLARNKVLPPT